MNIDHQYILGRAIRLSEDPNSQRYIIRAVYLHNPTRGPSIWAERCNQFGGKQGGKWICDYLSEVIFE